MIIYERRLNVTQLKEGNLSILIANSLFYVYWGEYPAVNWSAVFSPDQIMDFIEIYANMDKTKLYENNPVAAKNIEDKIRKRFVKILIESCNRADYETP
jgi:hypothetical protein